MSTIGSFQDHRYLLALYDAVDVDDVCDTQTEISGIIDDCDDMQWRWQASHKNIWPAVEPRGGPSTFGALGGFHSWRPPPPKTELQLSNAILPCKTAFLSNKHNNDHNDE